jgi:hypothetical protein
MSPSGDIGGRDGTLIDHIAQPEPGKIKLLHATMMFWVLRYLDGGLVVHVQHRWGGHRETEFLQHLAHPDDLFACLTSGHVLSFGGGQRNNGLALRHPGNNTSANLHNVGSSGATSVLATSMVGV